MDTVIITLTSSYQLVGSKGLWSILQNIGNTDISVILKSTAPITADRGFSLKSMDGASASAWGDEDVYVKASSGVGSVAILK